MNVSFSKFIRKLFYVMSTVFLIAPNYCVILHFGLVQLADLEFKTPGSSSPNAPTVCRLYPLPMSLAKIHFLLLLVLLLRLRDVSICSNLRANFSNFD